MSYQFITAEVKGRVGLITLNRPKQMNALNATLMQELAAAMYGYDADDGVGCLVITGNDKAFAAGADIVAMKGFDFMQAFKSDYITRDWEHIRRIRKPIIAAVAGYALGGGCELAMACDIIIAAESAKFGQPEINLGIFPGAGGTQRLPRIVGVQKALEHISQGQPVRAAKGKALGMIDELYPTKEALYEAAHAWIAANPKAKQPWDNKDYKWPAPAPSTPDARNMFLAACAMTYKKVGNTMPQIEAVICAIHEGGVVEFDRALEVEARYFVKCAVSDHSKDMIRTFWYHRNAALKGEGMPHADAHGFKKVGILGAGMMGAGLGFICADKKLEVVIKDIAEPALELGRKHCADEVKKKKHLSAEQQKEILDRITFSLDNASLDGCDLIIEAVIEKDEVKHAVTRELEPRMAPGAIWASNTSAIPITHLAKASIRPANFVGLHFFSPVEVMPLLEIIKGEQTSDETLGRCVAFTKMLGKVPILVNDGYGFFTSRVFGTYLMEAVQCVAEGHDPVLVEQAAKQAGMVISPLKVFDEVTLRLGYHGILQRERYMHENVSDVPGVKLLKALVEEHGRIGKAAGKGFYEYPAKGEGDRQIWPGLKDLVTAKPHHTGMEYLGDRLMLIQVNEVARCLEEKILREKRDAEVGAIFGIGFNPASGGPLAWVDRKGVKNVVAKLSALAQECGPRYAPAKILVDMAATNARFWDA